MTLAVYILFAIFFAAAAVAGARRARRARLADPVTRAAMCAVPPAIVALAAAAVKWVMYIPFRAWNAARLCHLFAPRYGYGMYTGVTSGPALPNHYGPVAALIYFPALVTENPTSAAITAGVVSCVVYSLPVIWLMVHYARRGGDRLSYVLAAVVAFGFLTFNTFPLWFTAFSITADPIVLGLAGCAAVALYTRDARRPNAGLWPAALFTAASVWTKQNAVFLLPALFLFLLFTDGAARAWRYAVYAAVALVVLTALMFWRFDVEAMVFNMFTFLRATPWAGEPVNFMAHAMEELLQFAITGLLVAVALWLAWMARCAAGGKFSRSLWLFAACAVCALPLALAGRVKLGGDANHLGLSLYFLMLFDVALLLECLASPALEKESEEGGLREVSLLVLVMSALLFVMNLSAVHSVALLLRRLETNPQQQAFLFARKHPGQAFFPREPLASLMVEGKLYHFAWEIEGRIAAGYPLAETHFRSHIPEKMMYLATHEPEYILGVRSYLPEFRRVVELEELPGWTVYVRDEGAPASGPRP